MAIKKRRVRPPVVKHAKSARVKKAKKAKSSRTPSKTGRRTTDAQRRVVLKRLAEHDMGAIVLVNLRDGIALGHLDNVDYIEFIDDFVLACGGEDCVTLAKDLYMEFRSSVFKRAADLRFRRAPPPVPCARICTVADQYKITEIAPDDRKLDIDEAFAGHGVVKPFAKVGDYQLAASRIKDGKLLAEGMLGVPPRIVWASCHTRTTNALARLDEEERADRLRNLLGLHIYETAAVLFLLDLPFPQNAAVKLAAPTIFEAPDLERFKSRYDKASNSDEFWGYTADLSKAYEDPLPPDGADGLPEMVLTPIKLSEDFGLIYVGSVATDVPGTVGDHLRYLLGKQERHEVVEELAA